MLAPQKGLWPLRKRNRASDGSPRKWRSWQRWKRFLPASAKARLALMFVRYLSNGKLRVSLLKCFLP